MTANGIMAKETGTEDQFPENHRWNDLENLAAPNRLEFYKIADSLGQPRLDAGAGSDGRAGSGAG